jgi:hypothetical protein
VTLARRSLRCADPLLAEARVGIFGVREQGTGSAPVPFFLAIVPGAAAPRSPAGVEAGSTHQRSRQCGTSGSDYQYQE